MTKLEHKCLSGIILLVFSGYVAHGLEISDIVVVSDNTIAAAIEIELPQEGSTSSYSATDTDSKTDFSVYRRKARSAACLRLARAVLF